MTTCVVAGVNVGLLVLVGKFHPTINSVALVAALSVCYKMQFPCVW